MKAIVLEVKNGYSALLREDGVVIRQRGVLEVGREVRVSAGTAPRWRRRLGTAAAAVAIVAAMTAGGWTYENALAYSYATLDVGSTSVEYVLNRRNQVIDVTALNASSEDSAAEILSQVKKQSLPEAISGTMARFDSEADSYAQVSVFSPDGERADALAEAVDGTMQDRRFDFHTETASSEDRQAARDADMSTGRWKLRQKSGQDGDFRNGDMDDLVKRDAPAGDSSDKTRPDGGKAPSGGDGKAKPDAAPGESGSPGGPAQNGGQSPADTEAHAGKPDAAQPGKPDSSQPNQPDSGQPNQPDSGQPNQQPPAAPARDTALASEPPEAPGPADNPQPEAPAEDASPGSPAENAPEAGQPTVPDPAGNPAGPMEGGANGIP